MTRASLKDFGLASDVLAEVMYPRCAKAVVGRNVTLVANAFETCHVTQNVLQQDGGRHDAIARSLRGAVNGVQVCLQRDSGPTDVQGDSP